MNASMAKRRLEEIAEEALHLRALIAIYSRGSPARFTRMAPKWQAALAFLHERRGHLVGLDEIQATLRESGHNLTRGQIRTQMHYWKRLGWIETPEQGAVTVTPRAPKIPKNARVKGLCS